METTNQTIPAEKPRVPTLVKIIALLYMLSGVIGIIGAIMFEVFGMKYGQLSPFRQYGTWGAVAIFVFALIALLISRGLRRRHNWARLAAIGLSALSAAGALYHYQANVGHAVWQFAVNLAIIVYLLFNLRVREAFKPVQHVRAS